LVLRSGGCLWIYRDKKLSVSCAFFVRRFRCGTIDKRQVLKLKVQKMLGMQISEKSVSHLMYR
jgi:hypothetical protein